MTKRAMRDGMTCYRCGRIARSAKLRFQGFDVRGWACACGECYYHPEDAERILALNKLRRPVLTAKLGRIRSNLILRIPKAVSEALALREKATVRLRVKDLRDFEVQLA